MENQENINKLGLAGAYEASLVNELTDRSDQFFNKLKKVYLDIENVGDINYIEPRGVLRYDLLNRVTSTSSYKTRATWKIPVQDEKYYFSDYKISTFIRDNFGIIHFGLIKNLPEDNSYYRKYRNFLLKFRITQDPIRGEEAFSRIPWEKTHYIDVATNSYQIKDIYRPSGYARNDLNFARISFDKPTIKTSSKGFLALLDTKNNNNYLSTCPVTGYAKVDLDPNNFESKSAKYFNTGISGANVKALTNRFKSSLYDKNYLTGDRGLINSIDSKYFYESPTGGSGKSYVYNRAGYHHIPYPVTVDSQNFYRFGVPTKICINNAVNDFKFNGLLLISTGNALNGTQQICYVSPHMIYSEVVNVLENFPNERIKMQMISGINSQVEELWRDSKIFQAKVLSLNSKNNIFHEKGIQKVTIPYQTSGVSITNTGDLNIFNQVPKNITINVERSFCSLTGHLKQSTPLKDTPFYKFYNQLYSGAKTIATGTWNGIIPSGIFVNVELVSTTFGHEKLGSYDDLVIVYSGQGTFDPIDKKLFESSRVDRFQSLFPGKSVEDGKLSFVGRSTSFSPGSSATLAKIDSRQRINTIINKFLKLNCPECIIENRKSKEFKKFKQELLYKQMNYETLNQLPNDYILSVEGGN